MENGWHLVGGKGSHVSVSVSSINGVSDSCQLGQCLLPLLADDAAGLCRRLDSLRAKIEASPEYKEVTKKLSDWPLDEVYCVGLGRFSRDVNSLQQLAIIELIHHDYSTHKHTDMRHRHTNMRHRHTDMNAEDARETADKRVDKKRDMTPCQRDEAWPSEACSIVIVEPLLSDFEISFLKSRRIYAKPVRPMFVSDLGQGKSFRDNDELTAFLPAVSERRRFVFAPHCPKAIVASLAIRVARDTKLLALMNDLKNYPDLEALAADIDADPPIELNSNSCIFADALHALTFQKAKVT